MSFSDLIWDISQEQRIAELEKQVKTLQEQIGVAFQWISHFKDISEKISVPNTEQNN
jgi:hypothetical protein